MSELQFHREKGFCRPELRKNLNYHDTKGHRHSETHNKYFQSTKVKEKGQMLS